MLDKSVFTMLDKSVFTMLDKSVFTLYYVGQDKVPMLDNTLSCIFCLLSGESRFLLSAFGSSFCIPPLLLTLDMAINCQK